MRSAALGLLALLFLGLAGLWFWRPARAKEAAPPAPSAHEQPLVVPGDQLIETLPAGPNGSARGTPDPKQVAAALSFDGEGIVRGRIGERGGAVFPLEWDLVLEPHPYLMGRERAETRRIPFRAGEREFRVEHLRLGGYRVRAEAHALNSSSADALLVKGSPDVFVELAFMPSGWFDGSVLDAQGAPAEGVEVCLCEATSQARLQTKTDGAGAFEFRSLLDGDYEISFCAGGQALLEPRLVSFRAPRLTFPQVTLPATGTLAVHVFDLLGKPAAGMRVTGFGRPQGRLDVRTDEQGIARLRWALPGRWEVEALDEAEQLSARGETEVAAQAEAQLVLRLTR
jgi:5-hydroxyisourate hydrolase-like protein (transthyretin family)